MIQHIKSVNIRSTDIKRRLLMSSLTVVTFESFLKDSIGDEVLIINTNVGMEIYYHSENDYGNFIKESTLLYTLKHIDNTKLKFRSSVNSDEVKKNFIEAIITFAKYPQMFLAYTKKFIHLRDTNTKSEYVMPILDGFFEDAMGLLAETGKVPHYEKIQKAKNKSQKLDANQKVIYDLISEILLKKHRN
ncbi:hypothetical protein SAMN04487910_2038 [Aquimarina amphilecti]|uniref:Uncharacterized protein n=2 Tax=Aquimarina amphilecti TaxID=1038014 RepID=A0A1H7NEQ3_AQUAM|nr:hypothetical protein SAMN04487910_2038 [Aquimarina amphilecti]